MKLFGYYAWHSFVNQLRKLLKTWVLVFLVVCMVMGGAIGFGAAMLSDAVSEEEDVIEEIEEEPSLLDELGVSPVEITELVVGVLSLGLFAFEAMGADKNGSKIFLPADVPLLFASPMKPQSVLLFRLATQMGVVLVFLFYLPNFTLNFNMSLGQALVALAALMLTLMAAKLLQVMLYTLCSTHREWKRYIRTGVYGVLGATAVSFMAYWKMGGQTELLSAVVSFFNAGVTRFIPFWGWIKGFCAFALEGKVISAILSLAATMVGFVILFRVIWNLDADFYEDAMAKSEETAELLARAQSEKTGGVAVAKKRKKDRADTLKRDGLDRGQGAYMFFQKSLYNRFRFAHFGIFTKTTETYLAVAALAAALSRFVLEMQTPVVVALALSGFVFFRALGNPLGEDTQMDFFRLIPESTWSKLFWSALAGAVNCVLDLVLPMLLASVILWINPLKMLLWLPLAVSVDLYATATGTFIDLSVPTSAGKMVKQLVQIFFIYFGLLPDIGIIAVGFVTEYVTISVVGAAVLNALLGLLFLAFGAACLEPKGGKPWKPETVLSPEEIKKAGKTFGSLGFGAFVILLLTTVLQLFLAGYAGKYLPELMEKEWAMWLLTFAPQYLVGVPAGLWLMKRVPAAVGEKKDPTFGQGVITVFISLFFLYGGNLVGTLINALMSFLPNVNTVNPVETFAMGTGLLPRILFMVVLAPLLEELIFRKTLIDRMRPYGERLAVVTSAAMFGLFHGNFSQMFYAFGLGLVFGYTYLRTGKLRYSVALHMFINFCGGVLAPMLLSYLDLTALSSENPEAMMAAVLNPWVIGYFAYVVVLIVGALVGLVLLCIYGKRLNFRGASMELPKGKRFSTVWCNWGMLLFLLGCMAMVILNMVGI